MDKSTDIATELVDGWIRSHHLWLKDGGGAAGMHKVPRQALIDRIDAALRSLEPKKPKPKTKKPGVEDARFKNG